MVGLLGHRGPDGAGIYRDGRALLGHTRLSIIDLSGGAQPIANEDETVWVTFNGEIFNYIELAEELRALGHRFHTRSDTEVIVHAYEQWGETCVERFNGQWAFVIWDEKNRRAFGSRDRVGVRPFFHTVHAGTWRFASEVKALFADPEVPRAIDPRGMDETFTFWSAVPPRTIFRGVQQLPPGHSVVVEKGEVRIRPYWIPSFPEKGRENLPSDAEAARALAEKLREATTLRLRADVPVGAYVSGGLDSSVVAALVKHRDDVPLRTFSLRFSDAEFDEGGPQKAVVDMLRTDHHDVKVSDADIARVFPDVIWHAEASILRTAPAPLFLLSRLVRQSNFKVVLTGEGADEFLAGYDIFREDRVRRFWARQPASELRPRLFGKLYPYMARSPVRSTAMARAFFGKGLDRPDAPGFSHLPRWDSTSKLKIFLSDEMRAATADFDGVGELCASLPADFARWHPLGRAQYLEIRTLLSGYILCCQGDRMMMGNSIEGRFPFLDKEVMTYSNALHPDRKLQVLDEKHVLKVASRGLIPREVLERKKQPYRAPDVPAFFRQGTPEYVEDLFGEAEVKRAGLFHPEAVGRLYAKCKKSTGPLSNTDNMGFVGVLSAMLVERQFVKERPADRSRPPAELSVLVDRA
jgi:asparagine synthase (glutamine-hydrolysing)